MEIILVKGDVYTVATKTECAVTSANGTPLGKATAENPLSFTALTDRVVLSDPNAEYARVNPKYAPVKLRLLGLLGGGKVNPLMKYAKCVTVADMIAVNPDYKNDLTADGEWIYPLPELEDGEQLFYEVKNLHIFNMRLPKLKKASQMLGFSGVRKVRIIAPLLENATTMVYSLGNLEEVYFELPVCTNYNYFMPGSGKAKRIIGSFALCKTAFAAFNINRSIEEIDARFPALESGERLFDGCRLKKTFALDCLNSIPFYTSGTHKITLGIHIDNQTDEEVLSAIANAEAKGWTVAVQWNGTATVQTVSTFGLRKPPIYAKLGSMVMPDGTTEHYLDWGHYATNAEANGYMEFSSVAEAREYFGLPAEAEIFN